MEAFDRHPPAWVEQAVHSLTFTCPRCGASAMQAQQVWINRRAPVMGYDNRRKFQEFYHCECEQAWWAWSDDRPPSEFAERYSQRDEEFD
jgi:hypothetical protein